MMVVELMFVLDTGSGEAAGAGAGMGVGAAVGVGRPPADEFALSSALVIVVRLTGGSVETGEGLE